MKDITDTAAMNQIAELLTNVDLSEVMFDNDALMYISEVVEQTGRKGGES